jgi:hypothetical protein
MKLTEFFSKPVDFHKTKEDLNTDKLSDELFWYIIDHDKLHKEYFFPIADKLKKLKECGTEMILEMFIPMVNKGCKEYYSHNKMQGKLGKLFPKDLREELCQRLYDYFKKDTDKNTYKLG